MKLIGLLIKYAGERNVDSPMPGSGIRVEHVTEIGNAGSGAGRRVMRNALWLCLFPE